MRAQGGRAPAGGFSQVAIFETGVVQRKRAR